MSACRGEVRDIYPFCFLLCNANIHSTVLRDVSERGRDVNGIIKQWLAYVKPNFTKVRSHRHVQILSACSPSC